MSDRSANVAIVLMMTREFRGRVCRVNLAELNATLSVLNDQREVKEAELNDLVEK